MASTTYHTIEIQNYHQDQRDEGKAKTSSAIMPGMLLEFDTGELDKHGVEAGVARPVLVAVENPLIDPLAVATAAIDTPYGNETVYFSRAKAGDVYYMFLAHSTGNSAVKGVSQLVSKGNGYLKVATVGTGTLEGAVVGVPDETVDNSAGTAAVRLRVRIS